MFILLYADDTVICSETPVGLQRSIDVLSTYCKRWALRINVSKTKAIVFSRGKVRKLPKLVCGDHNIEFVYGFNYLGVWFNYNNKFAMAQKKQYDKASRAMFGLIKKCKRLLLPLDVQIDLFDKMIAPILLYGCEVWCPYIQELVSKLQIRYLKLIMRLNGSTPTCMVLGESDQYPIEIQAKTRCLTFWFNVANNENQNKLSCVIYKVLFANYTQTDGYKSPYLSFIEKCLNDIGMSGVWASQGNVDKSSNVFKKEVKRILRDQFIQEWSSEVNTKDICYNYRLYKTIFSQENYLRCLPERLLYPILKFRTLNHKLPIQKGRWNDIPRDERLCSKCDTRDIGDEFHCIMSCPHFNEQRRKHIPKKYWKHPNIINFESLLCSKNKQTLTGLSYLVKYITSEFT